MAVDGKIRLKKTAIAKRIGQLFVDRASINLHSDILDHPDFFWEDDEWLSLYLKTSKYLEIERRAEVPTKPKSEGLQGTSRLNGTTNSETTTLSLTITLTPTQVLNKRLDIIKELFDMLASELHQSHSNKLEWIVIILIAIEVAPRPTCLPLLYTPSPSSWSVPNAARVMRLRGGGGRHTPCSQPP